MAFTRRPVQVARFSFAAGRQQQEALAQGHGLGYEVAVFSSLMPHFPSRTLSLS